MITTKFGNVKVNKRGYYQITSVKEGNCHKLLHRLIYEENYGVTLMDWAVIHHKDSNRTNNDINNLVAMTQNDHTRLHNKDNQYAKGHKHSEETLKKMSEAHKGLFHSETTKRNMSHANNTTGYRNVSIQKEKKVKQGFYYRYSYYEKGKQKSIRSIDIKKLKAKVLKKGLIWEEY